MSGEEDGFLTRWSRRKQEAEAAPAAPETPEPEAPPPVEDERSDEEILADLGLPHPDDLKPGDDVRGFMQAAVPGRLRRLALRSLWRSNPALANLDELIDYGEDFTDGATVVENMQTLYEVGKGMWREIGGADEDDPAPPEDPSEPPEETPATADAAAPEETGAPPRREDAEDAPAIAADAEADTEAEIAVTSRRMAFRFDD